MAGTWQQLRVGKGGWVCVYSSEVDFPIFLRTRDAGDRLVISELYISSDQPITAATLRALSLARIEANVNDTEIRESLRAQMGLPAPDLRTAASYFDQMYGKDVAVEGVRDGLVTTDPATWPEWPVLMMLGQDDGSPVRPGKRLRERRPRTPEIGLPPPLGRPDTADLDGFYRQVAEHYRAAVILSVRPAAQMAERAQVPVTTVHRWIREARRRGYLPPGRKGKTG